MFSGTFQSSKANKGRTKNLLGNLAAILNWNALWGVEGAKLIPDIETLHGFLWISRWMSSPQTWNWNSTKTFHVFGLSHQEIHRIPYKVYWAVKKRGPLDAPQCTAIEYGHQIAENARYYVCLYVAVFIMTMQSMPDMLYDAVHQAQLGFIWLKSFLTTMKLVNRNVCSKNAIPRRKSQTN